MRRVLVLLALPVLVQAQTMKPGLWEMKQKPELDPQRQAQMDKAQKAMENMSPAQRQVMEQMMASRGVNMSFAGGVVTVKVCVTKEQAERRFAPMGDHKSRCTHDVKYSGNVIQTHFSCPESGTEGDGITTLTGPDSFTNAVTMTHNRNGKVETTKVNGEGHWLGADCGDIKPLQSAAKP